MHATEFLKAVGSLDISPVLLLAGAETFLRDQVIRKLCRAILQEEGGGVGHERFDGADCSWFGILEAADSGMLLASHRLLEIKNADSLKAGAGSPELAALERYLQAPNPAVTMVFSAEAANRSHAFFKLLYQKAVVVECTPLKGAELRRWITSYLRDRGYSIHPAGIALVEEQLGSDLLKISNALEKVMLYCGERRNIEYDDLERTLDSAREHAVWELTNALGSRDTATALSKLSKLLDEGNHPLLLLAWIQNQFKQLLVVRSLLDKRLPPQEVAAKAGIRYYADRVLAQARLFSLAELRLILRLLYELEDGIKSAGPDERFLFEACLLKICRAKGNRKAAEGV
jgi:DNA polymerase-3 subunit delta